MTPMISSAKFSFPGLGLGTYKLTGTDGMHAIRNALDMGYRHIDTAQMYGNEKEVAHAISTSSIKRENVFITTKIWPSNFNRLVNAVEESLRSLQTAQVDLLLLHWPGGEEETERAMHDLNGVLHKGYAANVGVSNFNIKLLTKALKAAPIVCNQVEYHPFLNQQELLKFMRPKNLVLTSYSPLAQGKAVKDETIVEIAAKHKKTPSQVVLKWLLQQDAVAAIPKSASADRQKENLLVYDFSLSKQDMDDIFALNTDKHLVNASTAPAWD